MQRAGSANGFIFLGLPTLLYCRQMRSGFSGGLWLSAALLHNDCGPRLDCSKKKCSTGFVTLTEPLLESHVVATAIFANNPQLDLTNSPDLVQMGIITFLLP